MLAYNRFKATNKPIGALPNHNFIPAEIANYKACLQKQTILDIRYTIKKELVK
jgi:hypothetical protein